MRKGECLGLIGESGSGKTTLMNLITRLTPADEGRIILDGQDITTAKGKKLREAYRKMQMVFQNPSGSFDPRRKLGESVGESLTVRGMPRAVVRGKVLELMQECGLDEHYADRYPHEVSGGECQRAAIARALVTEPGLLICDEATSSLDVTVQKDIIDLLNNLRRRKGEELSVLFICHDIALVQQFCDRVMVMYRGRIVDEGIPDDLIRSPGSEYTKKLIDSVL
jgi:peptide/nickel transport system ATP-binding protein